MPNHIQGNGRNGRNVALPDENRPSWRPQEDDRYEDDRRMRGHWEDREHRDWDRDRDRDDWRGSYGQGQSGYAAGRQRDDRAMHFESRNHSYRDDRGEHDRGTDERWNGGNMYREQTGYGSQQRESWGGRGATDQGGMYGQGGYDEGMHGSGGMQNEYGSQGYQGYRGGHRGKGPMNYQRSDERIRESVCEALSEDDHIDASRIEVNVKDGEVTLTGSVEERHMKRLAEDVAERISGVKDVQNHIRISSEKPTKR